LLILLHGLYDLLVAYDLSRNIREFIRLRPGRTRSDYKGNGFMNNRWLAISNRRELAQEVLVVKECRLTLRLGALRVA
jgi:hypothetical protein